MDKRRIFGVLALAVITAVTAGVASPKMAAQRQETAEYQAPLEAAPVAQVEGETLSPNGRFQVRTAGKSEMYVSGYVVPEFLQIVDTETGELLWQDQGALWQSARWSPANNLVAIAYGGRTWTCLLYTSPPGAIPSWASRWTGSRARRFWRWRALPRP